MLGPVAITSISQAIGSGRFPGFVQRTAWWLGGRTSHLREDVEGVSADMSLIDLPPTGPDDQVIVASGTDGGTDWTLSAWTEPDRVFWRLALSRGTPPVAQGVGGGIGYAWLIESKAARQDAQRSASAQGAFIDWGAVTEAAFGGPAGGGPMWIDGVALDPSVASVRLILTGDRTVDIPVVGRDSGLPVGFFVHRLSAGQRLRWLVALDAEGSELERLDASLTLEV